MREIISYLSNELEVSAFRLAYQTEAVCQLNPATEAF